VNEHWWRKQCRQSARRPEIPENFRRVQFSHALKSRLRVFNAA